MKNPFSRGKVRGAETGETVHKLYAVLFEDNGNCLCGECDDYDPSAPEPALLDVKYVESAASLFDLVGLSHELERMGMYPGYVWAIDFLPDQPDVPSE